MWLNNSEALPHKSHVRLGLSISISSTNYNKAVYCNVCCDILCCNTFEHFGLVASSIQQCLLHTCQKRHWDDDKNQTYYCETRKEVPFHKRDRHMSQEFQTQPSNSWSLCILLRGRQMFPQELSMGTSMSSTTPIHIYSLCVYTLEA